MEDARRLKVYLRQQTERIGTLEAALLAAGQTRDAAVGESERLLNLFREVIDTRVLSSSMQGWEASLECAYKALHIGEAPAPANSGDETAIGGGGEGCHFMS